MITLIILKHWNCGGIINYCLCYIGDELDNWRSLTQCHSLSSSPLFFISATVAGRCCSGRVRQTIQLTAGLHLANTEHTGDHSSQLGPVSDTVLWTLWHTCSMIIHHSPSCAPTPLIQTLTTVRSVMSMVSLTSLKVLRRISRSGSPTLMAASLITRTWGTFLGRLCNNSCVMFVIVDISSALGSVPNVELETIRHMTETFQQRLTPGLTNNNSRLWRVDPGDSNNLIQVSFTVLLPDYSRDTQNIYHDQCTSASVDINQWCTLGFFRKITAKVWHYFSSRLEDLLSIVNCSIVSTTRNSQVDAYVLSESSMFISKRRFILKERFKYFRNLKNIFWHRPPPPKKK